ncbi:MAG: 6-bladed beta-propeller [Bacteroidetes bacterium]|nr:6-bladed beta-propeller [Bacteroidota bacterium]
MHSSFRVPIAVVAFSTAVVLYFGCSTERGSVQEEIPLLATDFVEAVGQDYFMKQVWTMQQVEDILYMSGEGYPYIFALDDDLEIIRTIGDGGKGPGEFSEWPNSFYVTEDRIYGYDAGPNRIQVFTLEGEYLYSFRLDPKHKIWSHGLSVDKQGHVYVATIFPQEPHSLAKLDSSGTPSKTFGELLETSYSEMLNRQLNARLATLVNSEYLLTVGFTVPLVEKFSLDGELIQSSDLSDTPYFSEGMKRAKDRYSSNLEGPVPTISLVRCIAATSTRMYIVPVVTYPDNSVRANRLLELDLESLELLRTYSLFDHLGEPLRWVGSIEFVSEKELILFHNTDGIFYRYTLSD